MPRRCAYKHPRFEDGQCPRPAGRGWTTCNSHHTAGRTTKTYPPKSKRPPNSGRRVGLTAHA